jgi:hypothetical protein
MKKIVTLTLIAVLAFGFTNITTAQTAKKKTTKKTTKKKADIWKTLEKVTYKKHYDETLGLYVDKPVFSSAIKKLDKKVVTIKGYIIPLEGYQDQNYFVFSKYPYNMCFFCGGAGPETVMEVETKKGKDIKYTSKMITIKGKLKLNDDNVDRLMYILEDATLVK